MLIWIPCRGCKEVIDYDKFRGYILYFKFAT